MFLATCFSGAKNNTEIFMNMKKRISFLVVAVILIVVLVAFLSPRGETLRMHMKKLWWLI